MKAMNNYVIIEQEVQKYGSITMKENNVGKVLSCAIDETLVGKTVIYSTAKAIQEYDDYKFVPYEFIMAILED